MLEQRKLLQFEEMHIYMYNLTYRIFFKPDIFLSFKLHMYL